VPERGDFPGAITSSIFNYNSGAYIAQALYTGGVDVWNNDRELYDHLDIYGLGGFPPVDSQPFTLSRISLLTTSLVVFASTDLPRELDASAFEQKSFELSWGIDFQTRYASFNIESITLIDRLPEITTWTLNANLLNLQIALPAPHSI